VSQQEPALEETGNSKVIQWSCGSLLMRVDDKSRYSVIIKLVAAARRVISEEEGNKRLKPSSTMLIT